MPVAQLWVFSTPNSAINQLQTLLAEFGLSGKFRTQPLETNAAQVKIEFDLPSDQIPNLVVEISRTQSVFELEVFAEPTERYLHHPALGICRNEFDHAGEVILRAGQLEHLLMETGGNLSEFSRGFRRLTGVPWLDLIEPYRKASEYLLALPRAV